MKTFLKYLNIACFVAIIALSISGRDEIKDEIIVSSQSVTNEIVAETENFQHNLNDARKSIAITLTSIQLDIQQVWRTLKSKFAVESPTLKDSKSKDNRILLSARIADSRNSIADIFNSIKEFYVYALRRIII